MKRTALAAALVAIAASTLAPARALELSAGPAPVVLDVTQSLFLDYHTVLDDALLDPDPEGVFDLRERLNLRLGWRQLTLGLRLDAAWFPDAPSDQYGSDLRVESLFASWRAGRWTFTAGDDYLSFGRGLALTLRKLDEVGFDITLRGAHVQYRSPQLRARLSAGLTNVVNVDAIEEKRVPDPDDLVFAGRVESRVVPNLVVGAHVVDVERRHSPLTEALPGTDPSPPLGGERALRSLVGGVSLEVPDLAGVGQLYAEADVLRTTTARDTARGERRDHSDGLAVYASATFFTGAWTFLAEAKHYDDYRLDSSLHPETWDAQGVTRTFPYIAPPTLERIDQRVQNNSDVSGAHLRADYRLPDGRDTAFVSGAVFTDAFAREADVAEDSVTSHAYGGWEHRAEAGHRWLAQAGYRYERAPTTGLRMTHFDLDVYLLVGGGHDLQLHWNHEFRTRNPGLGDLEDSYLEGTSYVSWNIAPRWSFTAQFEYLTERAAEATWFPGGFVAYRFTSDSFVRLFAGRSKGGLKCSGGVCRIFPDFEGVKLESTLRF